MRPSFKKAMVRNSKTALPSNRMKIQTLHSNLSVGKTGVVRSSITLTEGDKE